MDVLDQGGIFIHDSGFVHCLDEGTEEANEGVSEVNAALGLGDEGVVRDVLLLCC